MPSVWWFCKLTKKFNVRFFTFCYNVWEGPVEGFKRFYGSIENCFCGRKNEVMLWLCSAMYCLVCHLSSSCYFLHWPDDYFGCGNIVCLWKSYLTKGFLSISSSESWDESVKIYLDNGFTRAIRVVLNSEVWKTVKLKIVFSKEGFGS